MGVSTEKMGVLTEKMGVLTEKMGVSTEEVRMFEEAEVVEAVKPKQTPETPICSKYFFWCTCTRRNSRTC